MSKALSPRIRGEASRLFPERIALENGMSPEDAMDIVVDVVVCWFVGWLVGWWVGCLVVVVAVVVVLAGS